MAWDDLYADATVYFPLNGNVTPTINTTLAPSISVTGGTGGSTRVYENDAPPGCPYTSSYRVNGYSTAPGSFSFTSHMANAPGNLTNSFNYNDFYRGQTIAFWVKIDSTATPPNLGNAIRIAEIDVPSITANEIMTLSNGGANYMDPAGSAGRIQWTGMHYITGASSQSAFGDAAPSLRLMPGYWYHIAFVWAEYRNDTPLPSSAGYDGERAIFVNGEVVHHRWFTDISTIVSRTSGANLTSILSSNTGTLTNCTQKMSSWAFWNKPLSHSEIKNLYLANMSATSDYSSVVMAKNPSYFVKFNNINKSVDVDIDGTQAASWGPIIDDGINIDVNQESKFGKSWKLKHGGSLFQDNLYNVADGKTNLLSNVAEIMRSQEFTFEYWFKTPTLLGGTSENQIMSITANQSYTNNADYYIRFMNVTAGAPRVLYPRRTGTSTFVAGQLNLNTGTSGLSNSTSSTFQYNPGNSINRFSNNEWNHFVVTCSKTESSSETTGTTLRYRYYINGIMHGYQTESTYVPFDVIGNPMVFWYFGSGATAANINRDYFIDKFAIYPRKLSQNEVMQNYLAGATFLQSQSGVVKYWDGDSWETPSGTKVWNGTAWIDWTKSYWNGTSWVSI